MGVCRSLLSSGSSNLSKSATCMAHGLSGMTQLTVRGHPEVTQHKARSNSQKALLIFFHLYIFFLFVSVYSYFFCTLLTFHFHFRLLHSAATLKIKVLTSLRSLVGFEK
ncbi:hypothetical protein RIF29_17916 [Crotalaria pallida]|uniref:Uncharacterized protein n=1 Tax=Crotalaria pallida TaxID=3830 RepID=A0AAN9FIZ7_CROPI